MPGPFIFVGTYSIKSGNLEETRKHLQEVTDLVETNEPRLIAFNFYLSEAGNTVSCVQVHPDAASMEFHMKVAAHHIRDAFDYLDKTERLEVYGAAPEALTATLGGFVQPGAFALMPIHEAGFTRTNAVGSPLLERVLT